MLCLLGVCWLREVGSPDDEAVWKKVETVTERAYEIGDMVFWPPLPVSRVLLGLSAVKPRHSAQLTLSACPQFSPSDLVVMVPITSGLIFLFLPEVSALFRYTCCCRMLSVTDAAQADARLLAVRVGCLNISKNCPFNKGHHLFLKKTLPGNFQLQGVGK